MQLEFSYRRPPRLGRDGWWRARQFRLHGPADDHILTQVRRKGHFYELDLLEAIDQALPVASRCIIDVGANVGNHALYFAGVMQAQVIAVEPSAEALGFLRQNLDANQVSDQVQVHSIALSDRAGRAQLARGPDGNLGMSHLITGGADSPNSTVATTTLDALVDSAKPSIISAIKIDVEGHEAAVLSGAMQTLQTFRPLLVVEACDPPALKVLEDLLGPLGYRKRARYCATPTYLFSQQPLRVPGVVERSLHRCVRRLESLGNRQARFHD